MDGSFEQGPPPASGWMEVSNNACEWILDPTSIWGLPAYHGTYAFRAGGLCGVVNENYVEQTFSIPAGTTHLTFWYAAARSDPDGPLEDDVAYVEIDGVDEWTLDLSTQDNNTFDLSTQVGGFVRDAIDVTAFAGSTVTLRFGNQAGGAAGIGNILFDQIELVTCGLPNAVLHLRNRTISLTEVHQACFNIYAGPDLTVSGTGELILRAPEVGFRSGFSVLEGGTLDAGL